MLYLGIDGGGTKTEAVLCDETGRILAYQRTGATAPSSLSAEQLTQTLRELFKALALEKWGEIRGYAGISGCGTPWDRNVFLECCAPLLPSNVLLEVGSDSTCALNAEIGPNRDGLLLIVGTGSIAILRKGEQQIRVGGYGYLVGDEGSGFDMGRRAVSAALRAHDGRGPQTLLVRLVEEKGECPIEKITQSIYAGGRTEVASYASVLLAAAQAGDAVAMQHTEECIREWQLHIQTALAKAGTEQLPVVLAGGLLLSSPFLLERVRLALPQLSFHPLQTAPVCGAVLQALGRMPDDFRPRFQTEMRNMTKGV